MGDERNLRVARCLEEDRRLRAAWRQHGFTCTLDRALHKYVDVDKIQVLCQPSAHSVVQKNLCASVQLVSKFHRPDGEYEKCCYRAEFAVTLHLLLIHCIVALQCIDQVSTVVPPPVPCSIFFRVADGVVIALLL